MECDICEDEGHEASGCPLKGKCCLCKQEVHIARDCPNPWGIGVSNPFLGADDPTPAEAAAYSQSAPPPSASSTDSPSLDLRDNQLDELASQSQSILQQQRIPQLLVIP